MSLKHFLDKIFINWICIREGEFILLFLEILKVDNLFIKVITKVLKCS